MKFQEPMLAHDFSKSSDKLPEQVAVQPKLDGVRCVLTRKGAFTRTGRVLTGLDHVHRRMETVFKAYPNWVLDGELMGPPGMDFNTLSGIVRGSGDKYSVKFHCFDLIGAGSFERRISKLGKFRETLRLVGTYVVPKDQVKIMHKRFVKEGYEGVMVRDMKAKYEIGKRSHVLQKYKSFKDDEFKVVDVVEGTGKDAGTGILVLETHDSKYTFRARFKAPDEFRRKVWRERRGLIGKPATVRFFELSRNKIPRFPVAVAIRDYD